MTYVNRIATVMKMHPVTVRTKKERPRTSSAGVEDGVKIFAGVCEACPARRLTQYESRGNDDNGTPILHETRLSVDWKFTDIKPHRQTKRYSFGIYWLLETPALRLERNCCAMWRKECAVMPPWRILAVFLLKTVLSAGGMGSNKKGWRPL